MVRSPSVLQKIRAIGHFGNNKNWNANGQALRPWVRSSASTILSAGGFDAFEETDFGRQILHYLLTKTLDQHD